MATKIEGPDYNFLLIASNFCDKIDFYTELLGLDDNMVQTFKNGNRIFSFVFEKKEKYASCDENFTRFQIESLRINLSYLARCCRQSPNYSLLIGHDLGIEVSEYAFHAN
ncbi:MAG: hypothetical protein JWO06_989 [Bacteroidota bacterium]|nr:hypothetical protein [Bacteroidota bacterium]